MLIPSSQVTKKAEPILITAEEFAELMHASVRSIWRWNSAHIVPKPIRIGGMVRWRIDEVKTWIADGCPNLAARENVSRGN